MASSFAVSVTCCEDVYVPPEGEATVVGAVVSSPSIPFLSRVTESFLLVSYSIPAPEISSIVNVKVESLVLSDTRHVPPEFVVQVSLEPVDQVP